MRSSPDFRALLASIRRVSVLAISLSAAAWGSGFFGKVVAIGGHASDIALDEGRGVLYIANYTANRVEVMNTSNQTIPTSINVPFPGSLALSRDGKYLVVTTYSNFQAPVGQATNILTIIALDSNVRRTVALSAPPLAVAFGADGLALVLTTTEFLIVDPASAAVVTLDTVAAIAAKVLPVLGPSFPPEILTASMGVSGDGLTIYGFTDKIRFLYSVPDQAVLSGSYISTPTLGPRVVSVNQDGSLFVSGWLATDVQKGLSYEFTNVSGALNIGSHAIDSTAGLIYAQIPDFGPTPAAPTSSTQCFPNGVCVTLTTPPPAGTPPAVLGTPPNLMIVDADNLAVRRRLLIAENLGGRSILNAARDTLYSISDSGVTIFPVGSLSRQAQVAQVAPAQEDVVFLGAFCNRQTLTQDITIANPSGGQTDFRLSLVDPALARGISFSATSGVTPATVRVTIDPAAFQNINGTTTAYVRIDSDTAVNLQPATCPKPAGTSSYANGCIRLLINNRVPDQRGTLVNVPGLLVDLVADPARNRFYILRQDTNQVLVFDTANNSQIGTLRTGPTPMQMAITPDGKYMLVGLNDGHFISVFDLDTLQPSTAIRMPGGHYPRSVAVSGRTILAASRVAGPIHMISQVDFDSRTATALPSLGPFENNINSDTVLVASPHGAYIMAAMPDGNLLLYDSNADTFTVSRKDYAALSGAYAASDLGQFAVDNNILNQSLSRVALLDKGQGGTSGFAFAGQTVFRTSGPVTAGVAGAATPSAPGLIERVDLARPANPLATRTIEAPVFATGTGGSTAASGTVLSGVTAFIRSLATLSNGSLVSLTQSGFTTLPLNFDATTAKPVISSVVNTITADPKQLTAAGPISVLGTNLAQTTVSSNANPAPTVLGDSCVTVNGGVIPLFMVSPARINGQLPLSLTTGGQLIVYTPGGVSDPFNLAVQPAAPAVFQIPSAPGASDTIPAVYRTETGLPVTLTNPVHKGDQLTIYASGLGPTSPAVEAGTQAPSNPPALLLTKPVVTLDGATCPVTFAGLAPGSIGVYRIDVNVPKGIQQGLAISLTVAVGSITSPPVFVRVVE
jgi:uncharacterized protein (TIGR03437 family)